MFKKLLRFLYFIVGCALLVVVAGMVDIREVMARSLQIGWGMGIIIALHFVSFIADAFSWQMTISGVPLNKVWLYRVWKILLVGEALNMVIPAAGLGGEPIKAALLKRRHAVGYGEGVTSLILSQTIILISMVLFISAGFAFALFSQKISARYDTIAVVGLLVIGLGSSTVFFLQHANLSSIFRKLAIMIGLGERLETTLVHIGNIENRLVDFYRSQRPRFAGAVIMAVVPWVMGVPEVYYASIFLKHPVTFAEAWIIESSVQMALAVTPFIPAGLGVQEGVFVALLTAISGSPVLGGALAVIRRFRDIIWIFGGGVAGLAFFLTPATPDSEVRENLSG